MDSTVHYLRDKTAVFYAIITCIGIYVIYFLFSLLLYLIFLIYLPLICSPFYTRLFTYFQWDLQMLSAHKSLKY